MGVHEFSEEEVLALARHAYQKGQASFEIVTSRSALLVIDMQDEFVKPGWTPYWVPDATRMVSSVAEVIGHCREVGIPVIYTAFGGSHLNLDRPRSGAFMPNRYPADRADTGWFREGRIWHQLEPRKDEVVILKPSYGAFYDTPLETILRSLERDTVVIAGTLTNFCCGTTARQAYERGFHVVFGSDITATDDPDQQEPELCVLRKGFARVMTSSEIVLALPADIP